MFFEHISQAVKEYLVESSIHGLRYLVECKNLVEKVGWFLIIVTSIYLAATMISTSIKDNEDEPILTTIETASITNVPFPAITIAADGRANPWGFVQKTFNMMTFYGIDKKDESKNKELFEDSYKLRKEFGFVFKEIIENITEELEIQWKDWSLDDYKQHCNENEIKRIIQNKNVKKLNLIPRLAAIHLENITIFKKVQEEINDKFSETFFSTISYKMTSFFTNIITTTIESNTKTQDYSNETTQCDNEDEACKESLKQSYRLLFLPIEINKFPYNNLGFGTYLSYFSRLFDSGKGKGVVDFFNNNKMMTSGEKQIQNIMSKVLKQIANTDMGNISSYELTKLIHNNADEKPYQNKFLKFGPVTMEFDCNNPTKNQKYWVQGWNKYIHNISFEYGQLPKRPCFKNFYGYSAQNNHGNEYVADFSNCCKISQLIQNKLPTILKIMKYSIQSPVFYEPLENFLKSYDDLDFLPFNNLARFVNKNQRNLMEYNHNPRIFMCQFSEGKPVDVMIPKECQVFHLSITNAGIGYTFNNANFWDIFEKTTYTTLFSKLMRPKGFDIEKDEKEESIYPKNIMFPTNSGPFYGLQVFLEGNKIQKPGGGYEETLPFRLSVHDPLMIADLIGTGVDIMPGYRSTFIITPSQSITNKNTEHLPKEKRQCQFKNENRNVHLFKDYRQGNCLFECQLLSAFDKCGCIPWDYPFLNDSMAICDKFGRLCFQTFLVDPETITKCNESQCENDCVSTRYSYSVYSTKINAIALCKNKDFRDVLEFGTGYGKEKMPDINFRISPMFIRRYEQIVWQKDIDQIAMCQERVRNMAIVNFQIDSQFYNRIKRTQRVTFAGTLSNIGGTLGLFSGISLISMIELLFWTYRLIINYFKTSVHVVQENSTLG